MSKPERAADQQPKTKITGVYHVQLAEIMSQAATALGFYFQRVSEAGEKYPLEKGGSSIVGEGRVYIQLDVKKMSDFTEFWAKARELGYETQYSKIFKH